MLKNEGDTRDTDAGSRTDLPPIAETIPSKPPKDFPQPGQAGLYRLPASAGARGGKRDGHSAERRHRQLSFARAGGEMSPASAESIGRAVRFLSGSVALWIRLASHDKFWPDPATQLNTSTSASVMRPTSDRLGHAAKIRRPRRGPRARIQPASGKPLIAPWRTPLLA